MRLKKIRTDRGLSQNDLAELSGIDSSQLSRLETGGRTPNLITIKKVTDALGITLDELFHEIPTIVKTTSIPYYNSKINEGLEMLVIDPSVARDLDASQLMALHVSGDEMSPTIAPGDSVVFNKAETALNDGGIFAIETANGVTIGRIVYSKLTGSISITSDNPNHEDSKDADPTTFSVLGRVIAVQKLL